MSMNFSIYTTPSSQVAFSESVETSAHYNFLDDPFLSQTFKGADPLGITYNNPNYEGLSGLNEFSSEFTFASNNESTYPTELPCQPKDHSNVFAHQPTIQCKEPMPTTQRDPSSILIQCPAENVDAKEDYPWSPASFVSEFSLPSVRHSRASSCSFPLLQHSRNNAFPLPSNPQFTPQRHSTPECIGRTSSTWTPRHRDTSASPPSSGARSSKKRHSSPTPRFFTPIAPNLVGFQQVAGSRRGIGDDDTEWPSLKRQKSMISLPSPHTEVSEEDKWLLKLKDEDGLSWRDIQAKFSEEKGKEYHIPALQMRIKRLRDRMRVWSEGDVQALKLAHQFWTENKFEIIASKMADYGSTEKWTPKQCRQKWSDLYLSSDFISGLTSSSALTGSPGEFAP